MMEIYKPSRMIFIATGGINYGDDPDYATYYTYEWNVYLQLMLNFAYPEANIPIVRGMQAEEVMDRLKAFGSVNLHETNVDIVRQVLAKYPECETIIRNYEDLDLNPYVDEASTSIKS